VKETAMVARLGLERMTKKSAEGRSQPAAGRKQKAERRYLRILM